VQRILTNASREGARQGVRDGSTTFSVADTVENFLKGAEVSSATVTVTPDPPNSASYGAPVTVSVSVPFSEVSWLPSPMFLRGTTLTASTTMRRQAVH
jgi:hypothetical protein